VLPEVAIPAGEVAVSGLLAPAPSVGIRVGALPAVTSAPLLVTRLDPAELAATLGTPLAARVLRLDPALAVGYARDLDILPNTLPPERHRGYAVQWFAMAAALTLLSLFTLIRKGKS
jgi:cytochrome oxidase assembly protein ShyY1